MAPYTQTNTFSNGTTADGGQVNTEIVNLGTSVNNITNAQIDSAAAISRSKLATITRRLIIPHSGWRESTGTWTVSGQNVLYVMADSVQSYITTAVCMPSDWGGGDITVSFRLSDGTVAGNCFMTLLADVWKTGEASTNIVNATTAVAMLGTNNTQRAGSFTITGSDVEALDIIGLRVGRLGDNASDTCNGTNIYLVSVWLEYTANT